MWSGQRILKKSQEPGGGGDGSRNMTEVETRPTKPALVHKRD